MNIKSSKFCTNRECPDNILFTCGLYENIPINDFMSGEDGYIQNGAGEQNNKLTNAVQAEGAVPSMPANMYRTIREKKQ